MLEEEAQEVVVGLVPRAQQPAARDDQRRRAPQRAFERAILQPLDGCLKTAFALDGYSRFREGISQQFKKDYDAFLESTREWNREIFIARRLKVDIDDRIPKALDVIAKVRFGEIGAGSGNPSLPLEGVEIENDDRKNLETLFEELVPRYRYRGKFALKFLRVWLESLIGELKSQETGSVTLPAGCQTTVEHSELSLGAFASRSLIPQGLTDHLPAAAP